MAKERAMQTSGDCLWLVLTPQAPGGGVFFFKPVKYCFRPEIEFFEMGTAVLNINSVSVLEALSDV